MFLLESVVLNFDEADQQKDAPGANLAGELHSKPAEEFAFNQRYRVEIVPKCRELS
jgi:hypothetical protein